MCEANRLTQLVFRGTCTSRACLGSARPAPLAVRARAMPNGGPRGASSSPHHTSDSEGTQVRKQRWRLIGRLVLARWRRFVAWRRQMLSAALAARFPQPVVDKIFALVFVR